MTSKISRAEYFLRSKSPGYKAREAALYDLLRAELSESCYVSFSAGKDSAVIAHACHAVQPGIPMLMVDPGCPIHWTEAEKNRWLEYATREGWNLRLFPWDKFGSVSITNELADYREQVHRGMFAELTSWAEVHGLTRRVMGLRAEESRQRRLSLGATRGVTAASLCPISLWTAADVWAYHIAHRLPWLTIYDHVGPTARNGLIGRNGDAYGRLVYLRQHYPRAYQKARELLCL